VIRLGGELALYNAARLKEALVDAARSAPRRLVLDLSEVEFIDSTALGALIEARAALDSRGALLLAAPARETRRALEVSGLDRHLPVHDSVDAALAEIGSPTCSRPSTWAVSQRPATAAATSSRANAAAERSRWCRRARSIVR
jgi:anti-anti-sigma factor